MSQPWPRERGAFPYALPHALYLAACSASSGLSSSVVGNFFVFSDDSFLSFDLYQPLPFLWVRGPLLLCCLCPFAFSDLRFQRHSLSTFLFVRVSSAHSGPSYVICCRLRVCVVSRVRVFVVSEIGSSGFEIVSFFVHHVVCLDLSLGFVIHAVIVLYELVLLVCGGCP